MDATEKIDSLARRIAEKYDVPAPELIERAGDEDLVAVYGMHGAQGVAYALGDTARAIRWELDRAPKPDACDHCGGAGGWRGWPGYTCHKCGGTGRRSEAI